MLKYIMKRLLLLLPVLLGVTFIVFSLLHITPGDPAKMMLGEQADAQAIESLRDELGLNEPFIVQFGNYIKDIVTKGDIGTSYSTSKPVLDEILAVFPNTVMLATAATLLAIVLGIIFGIISAIRQYTLTDSIITIIALLGVSMPMFWVGLLLILLFSVNLGWLPPSGLDSFKSLIMPAIALGGQSIAIITRMTRSSMLEVIRQDFIRMARAKGQSERLVIFKHAFKNALIPIITVIGLQFGLLLGGAIITEAVFAIPGLGTLMIDAIKSRDFPIVLGGVLFIAATFSVVNLIVDILYSTVDPRVRTAVEE